MRPVDNPNGPLFGDGDPPDDNQSGGGTKGDRDTIVTPKK